MSQDLNDGSTRSWRVDHSHGIHVYDGDRFVATFDNPTDARRAVAAVNNAATVNKLSTPSVQQLPKGDHHE